VIDEDVKGQAVAKCDRACAVSIDHIESCPSAEAENIAIYANRGKRTDQRSISIELDAFYDCFRYRSTIGNVPAMRGKNN
jgi:hypothetical protein